MKRFLVLAIMPIVLLALEPVNLIKDAGFEKNSERWNAYAKTRTGEDLDSNAANAHDPERFFQGFFSASCDTRQPAPTVDSAVIIQGFAATKTVSDIDSLVLRYSIESNYDDFSNLHTAFIALNLDAGKASEWFAGYTLTAPDLNPNPQPPIKQLGVTDFPKDTMWHLLAEAIGADIIASGLVGLSVDSFILVGWGAFFPPWRGQKIYWDAIRLTGYADYDVGVKEILSGDSVWAGVYYKPVARIKSFGRQPADNFLAIAEMRQGETIVWADTIPYTLPADTEDTLEFDSFPIPNALDYTLTVRTEMTPDESDEDDELSKPLYGTAILEQPESQTATLKIESLSANPRISYSLPDGQSGVLRVYDASGRRIESLKIQGSGEVEFLPLASGVYFMKLECGKTNLTKKAVILR